MDFNSLNVIYSKKWFFGEWPDHFAFSKFIGGSCISKSDHILVGLEIYLMLAFLSDD